MGYRVADYFGNIPCIRLDIINISVKAGFSLLAFSNIFGEHRANAECPIESF